MICNRLIKNIIKRIVYKKWKKINPKFDFQSIESPFVLFQTTVIASELTTEIILIHRFVLIAFFHTIMLSLSHFGVHDFYVLLNEENQHYLSKNCCLIIMIHLIQFNLRNRYSNINMYWSCQEVYSVHFFSTIRFWNDLYQIFLRTHNTFLCHVLFWFHWTSFLFF